MEISSNLNGNSVMLRTPGVNAVGIDKHLSKAEQFRNLLNSNELEFLMEAHSGLSAKIVEEAGFHGIWASGLSISAALGVRDSNEASWTQVLDVVEFMSDATNIPILLDGDTGYGNFNNVRRLVRKLEQRDIAAVCMEDKIFPKTNSFLSSGTQELARKDEFAGKIKAAKDCQTDPNFSVVARLEGFISGCPLDDTLERADAYYSAGADALLVHSKKKNADEIALFVENWDRPCPLVIVPTTYADTPTDFFRSLGISVGIWANHTMRSSINAMQKVCREIRESESVAGLNGSIAPLGEVFRLQNTDELSEAEKRYLPGPNDSNGSNGFHGSASSNGSNGSKRNGALHHIGSNGTKGATALNGTNGASRR